MAKPVAQFNEALGHDVRVDSWELQGRSSYVLALQAAREGRAGDAAELASITVQEAQEAYDLYVLWLDRLPDLLGRHGVHELVLGPARATAAKVRGELRDGWAEYVDRVARFGMLVHEGEVDEASALLSSARETWEGAHDPATDNLAALLALGAAELGEAAVGSLWDSLLGHYYEGIAAKYDPATHLWSDSVERLALDIFEAVRGHLTGPERDGAFDVWEEDDRWVLEFAPCGSGGRTYPNAEGGDPERDPGEFTTDEHDWAWRTKGVCLYCVHCCQLQQRAPIDLIGIPLRVIEPPVVADGDSPGRSVCRWSLYKDPSKVPGHAYTDVGAPVPEWLSAGE